MRYEGIPDAYEQLKNLSRGAKLNKDSLYDVLLNLSTYLSNQKKSYYH